MVSTRALASPKLPLKRAAGSARAGSSAERAIEAFSFSRSMATGTARRAAAPVMAASAPKKKASPKPAASSPASSPRKRAKVDLEPPPGWRATYDLIEELRADRTAVVDKMGSEAISASAGDDRAYQTLISLMLSSQTKDTVNMATMVKLRAHGLTMRNILDTEDETLHELIRAVGFHNNKLRFIKETTRILVDEHAGRVPDSMDELMSLPGVGPKMALILLNVVYGKVVGISVDTHVHRISNQLGWAGAGTKAPEETRRALESWMPRSVWPHVNLLLVGLGQEVQTEREKLLRKCLACSDPARALRLISTCGVNVGKELAKAGIADAPHCVADEGL